MSDHTKRSCLKELRKEEERMAIEAKEVVMYIGKGLLFSIKTCYRTVRRHPLVSIVVFLLLILYRTFPSLFAFLVTSSPVILCTALLLGTLLSYGTPNIPHIEEEIKKTQEISSLQVGSAVDDLVTKKDETFTVETHVETSREVDERTVEEAALGEASTSAGNEVLRDVPFTMIRDMGYHDDDTLLPACFAASDMKEISSEKPIAEEREVCDPGPAEKGEFPLEKHPEGGPSDVGDLGLTVQITKPAPENLFDSSLGSPWQPIDSHEEASDSDSDSSGSSSPDASMADIIPMLDELHPLLDSGHPQATTRATGYSDSASSGSSTDDESDDGSAEEEIESKEDKGKEAVQEKDDSNEEAVPWTAADQKNVMDLGVSELERNRRLESLIAKRRARKLQRFVTEKNLIDLDSYYATPIPSISAPRSNPFDHSYDSFPGSAPSVLQPRQNPFDLPYDQVEKLSSLSRDYLSHHDFVSSPQGDMFSGTNENSTLGPSYSSDLHEESDNSKLKTYSVTERMDSEETEYTAFQRQLSDGTDLKLSSVSESNKVSSVTGQEDYNEQLLEPQVHQKSHLLPPANIGTEHFKQDSKSFEEVDSVDGENEKSRASVVDDHASDLNTSIVVEETCQPADSFSADEEEIGEAAANLPLSDAVKHEVVEHKYEESNSSSLEDNEKSSGMGTNEESANLDQTLNDFVQSDRAIDMPGAHPLYDSSPSLSNTSQLIEALLYEGKEDLISSSLASDGQVDFSEVVSQPKSLEKYPSFKDRDHVEVNGSVGEELASPPLCIASSSVSSVDEAELASREITEIKEHDSMQTEASKVGEDVPESAAGGTVLSSSFSYVDSESGDAHPIDVDKSTRYEGENIMDVPPPREESVIHPSTEAALEDSQASILDLPSIREETADDFKFEDVGAIATKPAVVSNITGLQVIDSPNLRLYDAEQQPSFDPKSSEDIGGNADTQYLVPGAENDVSVVSSVIPTHDGGATGMHSLEPTENREFATSSKMTSELKTECSNDSIHSEEDPTPSKTTSELEMESNSDLSHSEGGDTGEIQRRERLEITNNSSEDSDDEIYAGDTEIKEIDEGLLSELDAVGDFRADTEIKSDQGGPDVEPQLKSHFDSLEGSSAEMQDFPSQVQASEARPVSDAVTSPGIASEDTMSISREVDPVMDQPAFLKSEAESSVVPSQEEPEMTVYNPKLQVLEACSLEELDSFFKQHNENAVGPSSSGISFDSSGTSIPEVGASKLDITDKDSELKEHLHFLEAKSIEDISLALKQLSEGGIPKPSSSEAEPSGQDLPVATNLGPTETDVDLELLEAKSLEDIDLAFKQLSEGVVKSPTPPEVMEHEGGLTEGEGSQRHSQGEEVFEVQPAAAAASERHLEPELDEVQHPEQVDSEGPVDDIKDMVVEKNDEKPVGTTASGDVFDHTTPITRKSRKKVKSVKSGSGSSSSSSSSSSDSEG